MTIVVAAAVVVGTLTVLGSSSPATQTVTVRPGETLSSIVMRELPEMNSIRAVELIENLNGLADGSVRAGALLRLPTPR